MKSLLPLLERILQDCRIWCSTSTTRDFETISRRFEHEGLSFLMITLPAFCADFEKSLADGQVGPTLFRGFSKHKALPRFLGGLLDLVFDRNTGVLLDSPDVNSIWLIRQVCLVGKKIEYPCSEERVAQAFTRYVQTNEDVRVWEESSLHSPLNHTLSTEAQHFSEVAGFLWSACFPSDVVTVEKLVPRHGPGATAERISSNKKYELRSWHSRLEPYFPIDQFGIPSWNALEELDLVSFLSPEDEKPVRVIHVPKTLKTPRIIAIEPVCMQYTQQALLEMMVPILEDPKLLNGALGFTDQTVNQNLALTSSQTGSLATIDLKDASDRVSNRLVELMLASVPHLRDAVMACRSLRADVPNHGIVPLFRFASMGSALCFPIEAMVFLTIVVSAIARSRGHRLTAASIRSICGEVRIYGDDIIVPVDYVHIVKSELEVFNLQVNTSKTFGSGKFRESCGMDAYDGIQVTPVYLRSLLPSSRRDTRELLAVVSFRNQCYRNGLWKTAEYVDSLVRKFYDLPTIRATSALIGRESFSFIERGTRWDSNLHYSLTRGLIVVTKARLSVIDGYSALMKWFLKRGNQPFIDKDHLKYSGRPLAVYTKLRWALPF